MKFKFLKAAFTGFVLSVSCLVNIANAGIIGNLSHNTGDVYVTDTLNNLEWMHFDAAGNNGSVASLLASFSDSNSALFGFTLSGTTYADLFLDAAFGSQAYSTSASGFSVLDRNVDGLGLLNTMGVGFDGNNNNIWKYFSDDNVTTGDISYDFTAGLASNNNQLKHIGNVSTNPDSWKGAMSWLAYRPISTTLAPATAVPEPTTLAIFALGVIGLASRRFKKRS